MLRPAEMAGKGRRIESGSTDSVLLVLTEVERGSE